MTLTVEPSGSAFAARISGLDLRQPADAATVREFLRVMADYPVCVVGHDAPLTDEQHIAFGALLGPLERGPAPKIAGTGARVPFNEIIDQSNLDQDGTIYPDGDRRLAFKRANRLWHTDMSFYPVRATYSLLAAHEIPPTGADTEFVDMRAVYDALPAATKEKISDLVAEHSYWYSRVLGGRPEPTDDERKSRPPARHKLVHRHEPSGRKALYLASHIAAIVGWAPEEGRELVRDLMDFATQAKFVYSHRWRRGDVLVWDNLCTMHRATAFDDRLYRRDVRRVTCRETDTGLSQA
jgi:alpha-ketoglutarate-dependent 2,4-dichlorophenoxyacetate dioxygenase